MGKWYEKDKSETRPCKCGCGTIISRWQTNGKELFYVHGHGSRGKKQTKEHILKRIKKGDKHPLFKGNNIYQRNKGRRVYPRIFEGIRKTILHFIPMCQMCMLRKSVLVHHIDGNTYNNNFDNLLSLCKSCHYKVHYEYTSKL